MKFDLDSKKIVLSLSLTRDRFYIKGVLNPNFRTFSFELKKKLDFLK